MNKFPIFLSLVITTENKKDNFQKTLKNISNRLEELTDDYEIIIVDNASTDKNIGVLKDLTSATGLPNLQVYVLTKGVNRDAATWAGVENALGDFVVIFNPYEDDLNVLPKMIKKALDGSEVVFAVNKTVSKRNIFHRMAQKFFNLIYNRIDGALKYNQLPRYCILSRHIINFILQHNQPAISYLFLSTRSGFAKSYIEYHFEPKELQKNKLSKNIEKGIQIIASTSIAPMLIVIFLSLFGVVANLMYTLYVVLIGIFLENIASGWISMSLQMSGMFFLISLVLLVLGIYILNIVRQNNDGPAYHISQEFKSSKVKRLERLNLDENK